MTINQAIKQSQCQTCDGTGTVAVGKGTLRPHKRGCPVCIAGSLFEQRLARMEAAQRERDMDATGQDEEAFNGD